MTGVGGRSWRSPAQSSPAVLVGAAALFAAALCATLLVRDPRLGVAFVAAAAFVPLAFISPPIALVAWLTSAFLTGLPGMGAASNRALYLLVAIWAGTLFSRDPALAARARGRTPLLGIVVVFLAWVLMSLAWARELTDITDTVVNYLLAFAVFLIVSTFVAEPRHARWLAAAFVLGTVLSILTGIVTGLPGDGSAALETSSEGRLQGAVSDPNYLAAAIVPAMMLAGGLAARHGRPIARLALFAAIVVLAIGLAATESRGGFLALAVVAVAALLTWRGQRLKIAMLIVLVGCGAALYFAASPTSWERISAANDGGSGRTDIWQVAVRVVEDQPLRGVGLDQFPVVSQDYIREPGALSRADLIVDKRIVVHNVYLELWAETGIVGLLLFLAIALGSLWAGLRAAARFERDGDQASATLARAAALALLGALTASFFLSNLDDRRLWLLLAFTPVLLAIARRGGGTPEAAVRGE